MDIKKITVGELATNCYLLISNNEALIIDPGDQARDILKEINNSRAKAKMIVNTHYHFDHVGANSELKKATGALIAIHELEKPFIEFVPDIWLKDGDIINVGGVPLKVLGTPGHTPGGVCLIGSLFLFSGDTLFDGAIGRMDLPGGSISDMENSLAALDKLIPGGTKVYPGHGETFEYKKGQYQNFF